MFPYNPGSQPLRHAVRLEENQQAVQEAEQLGYLRAAAWASKRRAKGREARPRAVKPRAATVALLLIIILLVAVVAYAF